jgi:hypothetical protein
VGAFTDITYFSVASNGLSGTIPASVGNWIKIYTFFVDDNAFVGALPPMSFSTMAPPPSGPSPSPSGCTLFDARTTNRFECPWPAGAKAKCTKCDDNNSCALITDADCTRCTGASENLAADQCTAWQAFWDALGGDGWTGVSASCTRTDPCDCEEVGCSDNSASITSM